MTITSITGNNGTWSINPDQTIKFIPQTGFYGPATANYTVCDNTTPVALCTTSTIKINIGSAGQAPTAVDDNYTIYEDSIQLFDLLANDLPGSGSLNIVGIPVHPKNGKVSINVNNTISYLPNADYFGLDSFYYKISSSGGYLSTGKVVISIKHDCCGTGQYKKILGPVITTSQSLIATEDSYLKLKAANSNFGTDPSITLDRETTDKHVGVLKFDLSNLICYATLVRSATLKMQKISGNDQVVSVYRLLNNWSENQVTWNNRLSSTAWTMPGGEYNPAQLIDATGTPVSSIFSWNMNAIMQNMVCNSTLYPNNGFLIRVDETGGNRLTVFASRENTTAGVLLPTMLVTFDSAAFVCAAIPTRPPLSMPDTSSTISNSSILINVAGNDQLPPGNTGTISLLSGSVTSGTANIIGNNINYTPDLTFQGNASFQYIITDDVTGLKDTAKVFVYVAYPPPVANNDSLTILSGETGAKDIIINDIDPTGLGINYSIISGPKFGTYSVLGNNISYTAPFNFIGRDTITYKLTNAISGLCNENNASDTGYLIIIVNNRPPVATTDIATTNPCNPIVIDVLQNDTDPENGVLNIATVSSPVPAGSGSATTDGTYIYFTPNPAYVGVSSSFTYTIQDDAIPPMFSNPAVVTINFNTLPNQVPIPQNDTLDCIAGNSIFWNLMSNDLDPDNDSIFISLGNGLKNPSHGSVSIVNNFGLIQYTPDPGYRGVDSFQYQLCDVHYDNSGGSCGMHSDCKVATVYILTTDLFGILNNNSITLSASKYNKQHLLKWKVLEDKNISAYYIDRSSDGIFYNVISTKNVQNPANGFAREYSFIDALPMNGMNYYRIRIVRGNQPIQNSKIVSISGSASDTWRVIGPVPFSNQLKIEGNLSKQGNSEIQIFDANSHLVKYYNVQVTPGYNSIRLTDLSTLPAGFYIINISGEGQVFRQKITKID